MNLIEVAPAATVARLAVLLADHLEIAAHPSSTAAGSTSAG